MHKQNEDLLLKICTAIWGSYSGSPAYMVKELQEIIGLSNPKPNKSWKPETSEDYLKTYKFKDEVSESGREWCQHISKQEDIPGFSIKHDWVLTENNFHAGDWSFCPRCAAPRPIQKTVREELAEKLTTWHNTSDETSTDFDLNKKSLELADIAITFLESRRENAKD